MRSEGIVRVVLTVELMCCWVDELSVHDSLSLAVAVNLELIAHFQIAVHEILLETALR